MWQPSKNVANRKQLRQTTRKFNNLEIEVHQAMAVMDEYTVRLLDYKKLMRYPKYKKKCSTSSVNEFGRLNNGVGGHIKNPTNTIKFIKKKYIPSARRKYVTHGSFVCSVRNEKDENNRTRFVVGGYRINYPGEVENPIEDMLVAKLLFNSVVSIRNARFITMDMSIFYLVTALKRPEYIRISIKDIPD